jgi:hypothetical protein
MCVFYNYGLGKFVDMLSDKLQAIPVNPIVAWNALGKFKYLVPTCTRYGYKCEKLQTWLVAAETIYPILYSLENITHLVCDSICEIACVVVHFLTLNDHAVGR